MGYVDVVIIVVVSCTLLSVHRNKEMFDTADDALVRSIQDDLGHNFRCQWKDNRARLSALDTLFLVGMLTSQISSRQKDR